MDVWADDRHPPAVRVAHSAAGGWAVGPFEGKNAVALVDAADTSLGHPIGDDLPARVGDPQMGVIGVAKTETLAAGDER